jgi:hypothetical protein
VRRSEGRDNEPVPQRVLSRLFNLGRPSMAVYCLPLTGGRQPGAKEVGKHQATGFSIPTG